MHRFSSFFTCVDYLHKKKSIFDNVFATNIFIVYTFNDHSIRVTIEVERKIMSFYYTTFENR